MSPLVLLRALRPHQWSKNVFVLAALVFASGDRLAEDPIDRADVFRTIAAFVAFCLASSAVYLLNDVLDRESDRAHPERRARPIASGAVPLPVALGVSAILALISLWLGWWIGGEPYSVALVLITYMAVNVAYSVRLKSVVLLDVFCIATGFMLRVEAGGLSAGAAVSQPARGAPRGRSFLALAEFAGQLSPESPQSVALRPQSRRAFCSSVAWRAGSRAR